MSLETIVVAVLAIVVAVTAVFKAGESKGKKKEKLAGAEIAFEAEKEEADVEMEEKLALPPAGRVAAALQRARDRLARRGSG